MDSIINGVARFRDSEFPRQQALYRHLVHAGQKPAALMISCADSRVAPEHITASGPGEIFVCRNAGNIVPPVAQVNGGVSSAIEYAVLALGVRDVIVCGHSDCGAMKAILQPDSLAGMPNVQAWLRHSDAALRIVQEAYPASAQANLLHALAMENVVAQVGHLRTHPSVAARLATGQLTLHGWFFHIETGTVMVFDGQAKTFIPLPESGALPVAVAPDSRRSMSDRVVSAMAEAAR
ncbi:MAG: carbonic anhydrase [Rhodospirillales bacterium]|nr:carbonic anhydrase [Rhodospirillales bacterium]